jgi:shikimate dehydrogenase
VPMGVIAADLPAVLPQLFKLTNLRGALITMPHKISVVPLLDMRSTAVEIAGACNAVRRRDDGTFEGDLFDGEGFVCGLRRKGAPMRGARAMMVGCGGVGSAIAAALAAEGLSLLSLIDVTPGLALRLQQRLALHYPQMDVRLDLSDPAAHDLLINATPLGLRRDDPLPFDPASASRSTWVGDVVMGAASTPLIEAAKAHGCPVQEGIDMLYEQVPAYLEFFGFPSTTPDALRAASRL